MYPIYHKCCRQLHQIFFPVMDKHGVGKPPATTLAAKDCEIILNRIHIRVPTHTQETGNDCLSIHVCRCLHLFTVHTQYTHMYELIGCTCIGGTSDGALDIEHR